MKSIILHLFSLIIFYIVVVFFTCFHLQIVNATNVAFENVLVFGDSIVDPGNNNNLNTIAKSNFAPYGRDFEGHKPTGRFSNGMIPPDILAQELGIKQNLPAYLDPNLQLQDLITGVSFASAGSGYDPLTPPVLNALSLSDQLKLFEEYIAMLTSDLGEDKTRNILSKGLFLVCVGSNDIATTYFSTAFRRFMYDIDAYTDLMLNYALSFYQELYRLGARNIAVLSLPPIGCLPARRTLHGGLGRQCAESENQAALLFNSKLSSAVNALNKDAELVDAKIAYLDAYNPMLSLIQTPAQFGFQVAHRGCCGTGNIELGILCNALEDSITCKNASQYVFWDSYHPTETAYKIITQRIVNSVHNLF